MSRRDQHAYLEHIRAALERIAEYTADGKDAFLASTLQQDAVLRNLEVVGEAVKQLAPDVRAHAPSIAEAARASTLSLHPEPCSMLGFAGAHGRSRHRAGPSRCTHYVVRTAQC
ncbi:MAG: HepT-like ribonuclease domain-containing protein [Deltaproteobacteria bacterium]